MLGIQAEATAFLERWQFAEGAIGDIRGGTRNGVYVRRALERAEEVLRRSGVFPSRAVSESKLRQERSYPEDQDGPVSGPGNIKGRASQGLL